MLGLPKSTEMSKQLPKKAVYAKFHLNTAAKEKNRFRYFKNYDCKRDETRQNPCSGRRTGVQYICTSCHAQTWRV